MGQIESLVDRYLAVWNESDPEKRRREVAELWADDGVYANTGREFHGHSGIEEAVAEAYEEFVANGFIFQLSGFSENHDAARIAWEMVSSSGGDVVAAGTEYLILDKGGRIRSDHQFPEPSQA